MNNLLLLTFSIIILPIIYVYPQNTWNPPKNGVDIDTTFSVSINKNIPNIFLRFQEYSEYFSHTFRVELKKTIMGKPFQVIQSESSTYAGPLDFDYGHGHGKAGFNGIFVDINFDGYKDLRFKMDEGAGSYVVNGYYEYYIYNPKKNRFELNKDLSEVTNPTPFPDIKIVHSYERNAFAGTNGTVNEYKWKGRHLVLLKSYTYEAILDSCQTKNDYACNYKKMTKIYKNNKVIKSYSEIIKFQNIPKYHLHYW